MKQLISICFWALFMLISCSTCREIVEPIEPQTEIGCDIVYYIWVGRAWCNIDNPSVAQLDSLKAENSNWGWKEPDTSHFDNIYRCLNVVKSQWPEWKRNGQDYNVENFNRFRYCTWCGNRSYFTLEELEN